MIKTTETDTFRRLKAFMKDVDGDHRQIIKGLQDQVEYLLEKNRIYEEVAVEKNGGKQIILSDEQKKRLAVKGKQLNEFLLGTIEQTFAPGTIFGWYRDLVGKKYNSVAPGQKRRGHQPAQFFSGSKANGRLRKSILSILSILSNKKNVIFAYFRKNKSKTQNKT